MPAKELSENINTPITPTDGVRYAEKPSVQIEQEPVSIPSLPPVGTSGDVDLSEAGPSIFRTTERPFSYQYFDIHPSVVQSLYADGIHLQTALKEVDEYILDEMTTRKWGDTKKAYGDIIKEFLKSFEIHDNTNAIDKVIQLAERLRIFKQQKRAKIGDNISV